MALPNLQSRPRATTAEYLDLERAAEERHFFVDGEIHAMAGESPEHGDISANLVGIVVYQLKGKPCRARTKDAKVRSGPTLGAGDTVRCLFSYPDVVVICNEPEYLDEHKDVILNPKVIVEVLSGSTEAFDRGEKFTRYQTWNETLADYILVSQDKPQVEHYTRQIDGTWTYRLTTGLESTVAIKSIQCTLPLADIYERVVFKEPTVKS